MTGDSFLGLRSLFKSYTGTVNAIAGVSAEIRRGEFVSFLGPSGSGKTTTLMIVAGFERPTSGEVFLDGRSLVDVKPHKRDIGMVFQNYALFPHMTVAHNVSYPLKIRRQPSDEIHRRVGEALELMGLAAFGGRYPRELSGGQQQRVALARALVFKPHVLLLDEPLGALDRHLREQMQVEIKRIHTEVGITTIYVTHDQSEAMTLSDRIAIFNHGMIEQIGSPMEVYREPKTRFVASFVGDSNLLPATFEGGAATVPGLGPIKMPSNSAGRNLSRFHILIRPENVRVVDNDSSPDTNMVEMVVSSLLNYGDNVLVCGFIGGTQLRMKGRTADLERVRQGDRLKIGWQRSDSHLITG